MSSVTIKKQDDELQIAYGEVYIPMVPDSDGEFMTAEEIRKMAHRFLAKGIPGNIDSYHDNRLVGAVVVESFIARADDPVFIAGAWVVGVHIPDPDLWQRVKSGEFNGFSMEATVKRRDVELEMVLPDTIKGGTFPAGDPEHEHTFVVAYDDGGEFIGGRTNVVNGHYHDIIRGTITETAEDHFHKFAFVDIIAESMSEAEAQ